MAKILLVEDNDLIIRALKHYLDKEGYAVTVASNGREGIDILSKQSFDVVVTDLMMPFANGLDIIKAVRSGSALKRTGVIVVSSIGNESTLKEAFNLGADDYLTKPVVAADLLSRIKKLIPFSPRP
jgi:DNA-binding response OmpR family regulator